ncbi:MAG TPA: D-arabinono-1,4-lactone oxidase, partial [Chitinophagaceae bacterium]|nr:D-arabinono-1,4-lactone oxidase [Chitinophagaceae bacterium]HNL61013.1 D-arabinono-1,4-lactone oxidase [Chitinophagaceae bacterium]
KEAQRLLKEYKELLLQHGHTYNFVQEVRFTKADEFWLSPAYKRDTIWLSMYNMDTHENWNNQLKNFEAWAIKNGGRPHWGKEANINKEYLDKQYDKLPQFRNLLKQYDPDNKFLNEWNKHFL